MYSILRLTDAREAARVGPHPVHTGNGAPSARRQPRSNAALATAKQRRKRNSHRRTKVGDDDTVEFIEIGM